jgi:hypothetical protein
LRSKERKINGRVYTEEQVEKICGSKKAFGKKRAENFVRTNLGASGERLYCYKCPICGFHHITRKPQKGS